MTHQPPSSQDAQALTGLIHTIRRPPNIDPTRRTSAAILLHGWAGDETVMRVFDQVVPKTVTIIRPRAPIALAEGGYIWFDHRNQGDDQRQAGHRRATDRLTHFLEQLPTVYPIDPQRLLLIGFSQGGVMCNFIALSRPDLVAGVAPLAARLIDPPAPLPRAASLIGLPVFIAHGTKDPIIPIEEARHSRRIYRQLGAHITYGEYATGHKMNTQARRDLTAWVQRMLG